VVGLVLQGAGQQPVGFQFEHRAVELGQAGADGARAADRGAEVAD